MVPKFLACIFSMNNPPFLLKCAKAGGLPRAAAPCRSSRCVWELVLGGTHDLRRQLRLGRGALGGLDSD